jgi:hypothetical protein
MGPSRLFSIILLDKLYFTHLSRVVPLPSDIDEKKYTIRKQYQKTKALVVEHFY